MIVEGRVIEILPLRIPSPGDSLTMMEISRIWVVDQEGNEACVFARTEQSMPSLGDRVWWESEWVCFDGHRLGKVGRSFCLAAECCDD